MFSFFILTAQQSRPFAHQVLGALTLLPSTNTFILYNLEFCYKIFIKIKIFRIKRECVKKVIAKNTSSNIKLEES